jgi:alcohol dehydrogenase class IV
MLELPPQTTLDDLRAADLGRAAAWVSPSVAARANGTLPWPRATLAEAVTQGLDTLVVIGGGTMIDEAKAAVRDAGRPRRLVVIPSIWGSGAEASPVVVLNREGKKQIRIDRKYLPDYCVCWPELAKSVPADRARQACGDCWAHALEGFLSPLATDNVRDELSRVIQDMSATPLGNNPCWFQLSGRACAGQARSGVGLVHGIAHTLEHPLQTANPRDGWHHARLCATLLLPVMQFNRDTSDKWNCLNKTWPLDTDAIFHILRQLFEPASYAIILPLLEQHWMQVVRDPCSRTNSALVRPQSIEYFRAWKPA